MARYRLARDESTEGASRTFRADRSLHGFNDQSDDVEESQKAPKIQPLSRSFYSTKELLQLSPF